jgi:hypothetical protein
MNMKDQKRGSLLLVSMMIILVMSGLSLMAVRNVMLEHRQVGNYRAGEQALRITDSGMTSAVALAASKGEAFPVFVKASGNTVTMADTVSSYFDTTKTGSFGREYVNIGGVDFVTTLSAPVDTNRVPGYPVSDKFIWKKYRMYTDGYFGDQLINSEQVDTTIRNATRRYVSFSYVGPFAIGGGGQ